MGIFRPPRTAVPDKLMFYSWYFFILSRNLQAPSANRLESLPHDQNLGQFYNASPRICKPSPKTIPAKNLQKLGRFHTSSDFDQEYLQNESRYPKQEMHVITRDSLTFGEKGPVNFDPPTNKYLDFKCQLQKHDVLRWAKNVSYQDSTFTCCVVRLDIISS